MKTASRLQITFSGLIVGFSVCVYSQFSGPLSLESTLRFIKKEWDLRASRVRLKSTLPFIVQMIYFFPSVFVSVK